jgi:glucosamine--fructose-6-phosphate aminotransferase (isomerizing)
MTNALRQQARYQQSETWNEILSQGAVWQSVLQTLSSDRRIDSLLENSSEKHKWIFVGCGTSFYLAEAAAFTWTALTSLPAQAFPGSEILLNPQLIRAEGNSVQAVVISRSGKTSEAVRAASVLQRDLNIPAIGITCAENSPLEQACNASLVLHAADEKSTVMTRSFTSMLVALQFLAACRAGNTSFNDQLHAMAEQFKPRISSLSAYIEAFVNSHAFADYVFLGQGALHGIAREAALKVMEMSCSYSQFFHTLEFRHGPKAIVSPESCLTFFLSDAGYKAEAEVLREMKELGGVIISVCNRATDTVIRASNLLVEMNFTGHELASLAPAVVTSQLLGFFTGIRKGLNPDAPKNLSRVVMLD